MSDRRLLPKEHGAYGQLLLPLAGGLAMGSPTWASGLFAVAAVAAFVGHEPVLVLLGTRGRRARQEDGPRALRLGLVCGALALTAGATALWLAGPARAAAALALVFALVLVPFVLREKEKTAVGEVVAAGALAGASLPVAAAGGVAFTTAVAAWGAWLVAFSASTAAVRTVITRHKKGARAPIDVAVLTLATLGGMVLAAKAPAGYASLPMLAAAWVLFFLRIHPRRLKLVGWSLVTCSVATLAVLLVAAT
jgi:hypothetical protein